MYDLPGKTRRRPLERTLMDSDLDARIRQPLQLGLHDVVDRAAARITG